MLAIAIGFPFFIIAAGAPVLQNWFAQSRHRAARDPYFLYAASNGGSLAGLLAYPILVEPNLTLPQQSRFWFYGYLGLTLLVGLCALVYLRALTRPAIDTADSKAGSQADTESRLEDGPPIAWPRRLRWLFWSLVPSSLLCGVTTYITTDVVSAPLIWVITLAAYLLSFICAFGGGAWMLSPFFVRRQAFLLLGAALTVAMGATSPVYIVLPLHLIAFFVTATLCHGRLAQDRPPPAHLTNFYLWISLGGVLGGMFNAVLAPQIFTSVVEYPLMMVAAAFSRPSFTADDGRVRRNKMDWLLPVLLLIVMVGLVEIARLVPGMSRANLQLIVFGVSAIVCLSFAPGPLRFGLGFVALYAVAAVFPPLFGAAIFSDRSFFGAYRVTQDAARHRRLLFHGTTIHGAQNLDPDNRLHPLTYYHRSGPAGQVLRAGAQSDAANHVAIVGLGTGALACHGAASQHFTFYEIDPLMERVARDPRLFTYMRDCSPRIDVVIGDARLMLAKAPDRSYDILVLDAFSSDVIPMHLLTRQALELYLSKTAMDGLLLIHISNRYMDLAPVLDRLAKQLQLTALLQDDVEVSAEETAEGKNPSRWVLLARAGQMPKRLTDDPRWRLLHGQLGGDLWTDEFSDVLNVLRWR